MSRQQGDIVGAAKLPEQIVQRVEDGLRAMEEDRKRDPVIERLMAQPVKRTIKLEEKNRRRPRSAEAEKSRLTVAKRLIIERQLRALRHKIDTLRSNPPTARTKTLEEQIGSLRRQARRLREMLPVKAPSKKRAKRSKKGRSKRPMRR